MLSTCLTKCSHQVKCVYVTKLSHRQAQEAQTCWLWTPPRPPIPSRLRPQPTAGRFRFNDFTITIVRVAEQPQSRPQEMGGGKNIPKTAITCTLHTTQYLVASSARSRLSFLGSPQTKFNGPWQTGGPRQAGLSLSSIPKLLAFTQLHVAVVVGWVRGSFVRA